MSEAVGERIRRMIRERGPISFDRYMREALYGLGGFYERPPIGEGGEFVTAPHVHPIFSRLVGAAIESLWEELGRPVPLRLVEVGAGDGTMGRELLAGFGRAGIELEYDAVEIAPGAREALHAITPRVFGRLQDVEPLDRGVVLANELLDNLPFRRVRARGGEVVEIRVGLDGDRLVEVEIPGSVDLASNVLEDGTETTVPVGALAFVDELAARMPTGYALLIDYAAVPGGGDVHGYRGHRVIADVLEDPGSTDITAGVDFGQITARARGLGMHAFEPVAQSSALAALGFEIWAREELAQQAAELNTTRSAVAVRTWEGRSRARLLVDPVGLGRLRWLVLAAGDLPEPPWLARARELPVR